MAPLGSSETAQSRCSSGVCSSFLAPASTSGFGPNLYPHLQRLLQSSASTNEDTRFQNLPQVAQYYLQRGRQASQNGDVERSEFLSNGDLHLEPKRSADPSQEALSRGSTGTTSGTSVDRLSNHGTALPSPHASYRCAFDNSNGDLLSQIAMDVEGAPLMRAPDGLSEAGRTGLEAASSYHVRGSLAPSSSQLETDTGVVLGAVASKNILLRHSSSPAGLLSQLNDDNERHLLRSSSGNASTEDSYERQGGPPYLGGKFSWDEAGDGVIGSPSAVCAARKRFRDLEERVYSQKGDGFENGVLDNYFGLPSSMSPENTYFSDKMSPDSIPCRTRAKRGCATHPRSIAERVRRTKISERMKKLQDLVPNMDKQTNTAEMLDEAVEYVKYLQRQVQELTESRSKCECSCRAREASPK